MDKKYILALVLIFVLLVGYSLLSSYIHGPKPTKEEKTTTEEKEQTVEATTKPPTEEKPTEVVPPEKEKTVAETETPPGEQKETVQITETTLLAEKKEVPVKVIIEDILDLTLVNGEISEYHFTKYERRNPEDKQPLTMYQEQKLPLTIEFKSSLLQSIADSGFTPDREGIALKDGEKATLTLTAEEPGNPNRQLIKRITFNGDNYMIDVEIETVGLEKELAEGYTVWAGSFYDAEKEWSPREVKAITKVGDELKKDELKKDTADLSHEGAVNWTSLNNKYFAAIIIPQSGDCKLTEIYRTKNEQLGVSAELSGENPFRFYIGPKEYDRLKSYDLNLEKTVDLGWSWIAPLSRLFLKLLQWSNRLTGNYGVDILILSVVLKVIMIPLTQWSLRSTKSMQLLQPKIAELKEKYKGEPEKLNAETFALYKKYKINPVSGCIPLLLQMPIFIALFNALRNTVELYGAKFVWWITDLSQADALFRLPFVIPLLNTDKFAVLPLLMIVAMVVQNAVSTKGTSGKKGEQQKMMTFLPIIFGFIFYTMPAGLVLYWLVNTVLTVVQQVYMVKPVEALKEA